MSAICPEAKREKKKKAGPKARSKAKAKAKPKAASRRTSRKRKAEEIDDEQDDTDHEPPDVKVESDDDELQQAGLPAEVEGGSDQPAVFSHDQCEPDVPAASSEGSAPSQVHPMEGVDLSESADAQASCLPQCSGQSSGSGLANPEEEAQEQEQSSASARGPIGPKVHASPLEILKKLQPNDKFRFYVDKNVHRFRLETKVSDDRFKHPFDTKTFNRSFQHCSWRSVLKEMHEHCWKKWQIVQDTFPADKDVQEPGVLPESVVAELAATMDSLPQAVTYPRKSK